ncbi:hypothetical protein U1Q18_047832 [Sarracenia purpurea var. burkii]
MVKNSRIKKIDGKALGISPALPIFVNEHMPKEMMEIYNAAKEMRKNEIVQFVWYRGGYVYVRENQNARALKIASMVQLEEEAVRMQAEVGNKEDEENDSQSGEKKDKNEGDSGKEDTRELRSGKQKLTTIEQMLANSSRNKNTTGNKHTRRKK